MPPRSRHREEAWGVAAPYRGTRRLDAEDGDNVSHLSGQNLSSISKLSGGAPSRWPVEIQVRPQQAASLSTSPGSFLAEVVVTSRPDAMNHGSERCSRNILEGIAVPGCSWPWWAGGPCSPGDPNGHAAQRAPQATRLIRHVDLFRDSVRQGETPGQALVGATVTESVADRPAEAGRNRNEATEDRCCRSRDRSPRC